MTTPLGRPAEPIPFWAENDLYPAGTDPWSSTPLKVQPAVGVRNVGHEPAQQVPAQYENAIKSAAARYIDYLVDMPFMNHSPLVVNDLDTSALAIGYNGAAGTFSFWSEYHHFWIILGAATAGRFYFGDPNNSIQHISGAGASHWSIGCVAGFSAGAINAGNFVLVCGDIAATIPYVQVSSSMGTLSTGNLPGTAAGAYASHAITSQNRFIVVGSDNGTTANVVIWKSDDYGGTWTKQTLSATSNGMNYRAVVGHNGEIVIMSTDGGGGVNAFYSTDNGNTWTTKTTGLPTTTILHSIYYSAQLDTYVLAGLTQIYTCVGSITNGFTSTTMSSDIIGGNLTAFALIGNALYLETGQGWGTNAYRWLSWDLGIHARLVNFATVGPSAGRLYGGPHSVLWTSTVSVQETLRTSGIGSVARAV